MTSILKIRKPNTPFSHVKLREGTPPDHDTSERTSIAEGERFIKMMNEREILYGI